MSLETRNLESVCKLEILILETQDFQFREILRFKTQNYELVNSKFRVPKLRISRFETQNFEFANKKFRFSKLKISNLQKKNLYLEAEKLITKRHVHNGLPYLTAIK